MFPQNNFGLDAHTKGHGLDGADYSLQRESVGIKHATALVLLPPKFNFFNHILKLFSHMGHGLRALLPCGTDFFAGARGVVKNGHVYAHVRAPAGICHHSGSCRKRNLDRFNFLFNIFVACPV